MRRVGSGPGLRHLEHRLRHVHERTVTHLVRQTAVSTLSDVALSARLGFDRLLFVVEVRVTLGHRVVPRGLGKLGTRGHKCTVGEVVGQQNVAVVVLRVEFVILVELDGLWSFERQQRLLEQLPTGVRVLARRCLGGRCSQHLGTLKEDALTSGDVIASGTALLILGESVVVATDLTHGGINARVAGVLPHLRLGEVHEVAGDGVTHLSIGAIAGFVVLDRSGTGVISEHAGREEHHVSVQVIIPVSFRRPGHTGVRRVDGDAAVAVAVGTGPVHHIGGLVDLNFPRTVNLVLAPAH